MTAREALTAHYTAVGSAIPCWLADTDELACRTLALAVIGQDVQYDAEDVADEFDLMQERKT